MDRLGPFEACPRVAVAVSGGADSTALVLLANEWAVRRGGDVLALIVDHRLRAGSSHEADVTLLRLEALGIPGRKLTVSDLARGPGLAGRAREARYRLLLDVCAEYGIPHLLVGHHRGDQVETVMMRALSASTARGLAGMPALTETRSVRLLRPLLDTPPERLRALLSARGVAWVEDPSNHDPAALRSRLRVARADPSGTGEGTHAVAVSAGRAGEHRAERDLAIARILAERATIRPEGHAILTPGPIEPEALAALFRTLAGASHAPPIHRVAAIARALRPATLGGVRMLPAGRLGTGWLLIREPRAMEPPMRVRPNAVWDGRFRLAGGPPEMFAPEMFARKLSAAETFAEDVTAQGGVAQGGAGSDGNLHGGLPPEGHAPIRNDPIGNSRVLTLDGRVLTLGGLGADAVGFRNRTGLPTLVLHGLPALRSGGMLVSVPHIGVGDPRWRLLFDPRNCAAGAPFLVGAGLIGSRFQFE
jgi:tRNA(Ile)-lysidine synthase